MSRTLYHLLWSNLAENPMGNGMVSPAESPAIGIPFRIAAKMLLEALEGKRTRRRMWSFSEESWALLVEGRRSQLGGETGGSLGREISRFLGAEVMRWPIPSHAAYSLPLVKSQSVTSDWVNTLLFVTAISGDEQILQQIFLRSPAAVRFDERWKLRSRFPMPVSVWHWIEELFRAGRNGSPKSESLAQARGEVVSSLSEIFRNAPVVLPDDFVCERVDVLLDNSRSEEYPCAVSRRTLLGNLSERKFRLRKNHLQKNFRVRIAQMTAEPEWLSLPQRFPRFSRREVNAVRKELLQVFPGKAIDESKWELAVFPEVYLPSSTIPTFERTVRETGRAGLAGCLWRVVPTAMASYSAGVGLKYLVNEALLVVPVEKQARRNLIRARAFFIRKPLPTHIEVAFAEKLGEENDNPESFKLLPGRRVMRFVHPAWGDFTVAICSDLIDANLWNSLRGQVLHLLSCAYNKDVNLFDALTWVRAYELCANVVATNCGHYGGSFAWSPRSGETKELARIRGGRQLVMADIDLPVKSLAVWQESGVLRSVEKCLSDWSSEDKDRDSRNTSNPPKVDEDPNPRKYKAPPPGFPARTFDAD